MQCELLPVEKGQGATTKVLYIVLIPLYMTPSTKERCRSKTSMTELSERGGGTLKVMGNTEYNIMT